MTARPADARRPLQVLVTALAAALVTTALHLTVTTVDRELLGHFSWMWWTRDQLWVTPLAYAAIYLALAIPVAGVHALAPGWVTEARVAAGYAALTALSVFLLFSRIASWAWIVLALGIGLQVARWAASRTAGLRRTTAWLAGALGVAFLTLGGGSYWRGRSAERAALAALPTAPSGAPNVLLLILDTVRASDVSIFDSTHATAPALAARARDGVVFEQAYSTAPWTLPSHASMFTGRYASQQSGDWKTPLDGEPATLAEIFRDRGYATGGFVANLIATSYRTGLARGFVHYEDVRRTPTEVMYNTTLTQSTAVARAWQLWRNERWLVGALRELASFDLRPNGNYTSHERKNAQVVAGDFLRWQATLGARPFFAFLNLFDAHGPYEPPAPYRELFPPTGKALGRYRGAVRYMDETIDSLLATLDRRGALSNTIVVVTSDHGELFGEHGLSGHGNGLYRPLLHVPLVLLAPGRVAPGVRVAQTVSLRDLAPTVLDLAGVSPNERGIGGRSLVPLSRGQGGGIPSRAVAEVNRGINDDPRNPTAAADLKTALDDTLHAIATSRGGLQAFAHAADPEERVDLARDPVRRAAVAAWVDHVLDSVEVRWPQRAAARVPTVQGTIDTAPDGSARRRKRRAAEGTP